MMSKAELLEWVNRLPDESSIAIGEGGLDLEARYPDGDSEHIPGDDYDAYLEIGGWPLPEDIDAAGR